MKLLPVRIYDNIMELEEIDLDDRAVSILRTLRDLGGECTTRDVRDALDLSRGIVNYRIDEYLEPHNLLIGENQKVEPGEMRPKVLKITDRGIEYLETMEDSKTGDSIPGRVEKLENEVEELRNKNKELKREISSFSDYTDTLDWMYYRIAAVADLSNIDKEELHHAHIRRQNIMEEVKEE